MQHRHALLNLLYLETEWIEVEAQDLGGLSSVVRMYIRYISYDGNILWKDQFSWKRQLLSDQDINTFHAPFLFLRISAHDSWNEMASSYQIDVLQVVWFT